MAIYGYTRVSTNEQTTENQRQQIDGKGYRIDEWFDDTGVSGSVETCDRKGWRAMMGVVKKGDTIIAVSIDRLGRNSIDVQIVMRDLYEQGITVITLREGIDMSTAAGELVLAIMASVAQMERRIISERVKSGMARASREIDPETGRPKHMGRPKVYDIDAQVAKLVAQGLTGMEIAKQLGVSNATVSRAKKKIKAPE
ncbi:recombinase family protein [Aeromonas veronii]|jgi:DNA invertase Pin-like site-specific DNA recombinase|uniref:recombinase family protein n=1 Tax=Aeromonas veronii TaxID=654 RepID=UPI003D25B6AD